VPNCHLLKAAGVLTLVMVKGRNNYSFYTVIGKFIAKTTAKRNCNHTRESSYCNKMWL